MSEQLMQRFLSDEVMEFDDLMSLLTWAATAFDVADYEGNRERKTEMSKLSLSLRPACVRAQKQGTSFLTDRAR
jgi:hypothetical protein